MTELAALLAILTALLIGAVSPGPSFVVVSKVSVSGSRLDGLAAALGMGAGGALFGTVALLGLSALLLQVEWLYIGLKVLGGAYLIYLGYRIWRGAGEPIASDAASRYKQTSLLRSFGFALVTQISNPKTAIVYASIFAALLPPSPPTWLLVVLPPLIFLIEAGWYALVALAFSASRPRAGYLRSKLWVDRTAGVILGAIGGRLLFGALQAQRAQ
ncbi:MAG: LysE family transporter [Pseudomonadota bacterium]